MTETGCGDKSPPEHDWTSEQVCSRVCEREFADHHTGVNNHPI